MLPFEQTRVRLYGDETLAQDYIGAARRLLFQVKQIVANTGVPVYALTQEIEGGYIQASYHGGLMALTIQAQPVTGKEESSRDYREMPMGLFVQTTPEGYLNEDEDDEKGGHCWLFGADRRIYLKWRGGIHKDSNIYELIDADDPYGRGNYKGYFDWYAKRAIANYTQAFGAPGSKLESREMWGGLQAPWRAKPIDGAVVWPIYIDNDDGGYVRRYIHADYPLISLQQWEDSKGPNPWDEGVKEFELRISPSRFPGHDDETPITVELENGYMGACEILDITPDGRRLLIGHCSESSYMSFVGKPYAMSEGIHEVTISESGQEAEAVLLYSADPSFYGGQPMMTVTEESAVKVSKGDMVWEPTITQTTSNGEPIGVFVSEFDYEEYWERFNDNILSFQRFGYGRSNLYDGPPPSNDGPSTLTTVIDWGTNTKPESGNRLRVSVNLGYTETVTESTSVIVGALYVEDSESGFVVQPVEYVYTQTKIEDVTQTPPNNIGSVEIDVKRHVFRKHIPGLPGYEYDEIHITYTIDRFVDNFQLSVQIEKTVTFTGSSFGIKCGDSEVMVDIEVSSDYSSTTSKTFGFEMFEHESYSAQSWQYRNPESDFFVPNPLDTGFIIKEITGSTEQITPAVFNLVGEAPDYHFTTSEPETNIYNYSPFDPTQVLGINDDWNITRYPGTMLSDLPVIARDQDLNGDPDLDLLHATSLHGSPYLLTQYYGFIRAFGGGRGCFPFNVSEPSSPTGVSINLGYGYPYTALALLDSQTFGCEVFLNRSGNCYQMQFFGFNKPSIDPVETEISYSSIITPAGVTSTLSKDENGDDEPAQIVVEMQPDFIANMENGDEIDNFRYPFMMRDNVTFNPITRQVVAQTLHPCNWQGKYYHPNFKIPKLEGVDEEWDDPHGKVLFLTEVELPTGDGWDIEVDESSYYKLIRKE